MVQPKIVLLIFVSGKLVLTGGKSREQIYKAFENIYPVLLGKKKRTSLFTQIHINYTHRI